LKDLWGRILLFHKTLFIALGKKLDKKPISLNTFIPLNFFSKKYRIYSKNNEKKNNLHIIPKIMKFIS
jgi:hypothetical protein